MFKKLMDLGIDSSPLLNIEMKFIKYSVNISNFLLPGLTNNFTYADCLVDWLESHQWEKTVNTYITQTIEEPNTHNMVGSMNMLFKNYVHTVNDKQILACVTPVREEKLVLNSLRRHLATCYQRWQWCFLLLESHAS